MRSRALIIGGGIAGTAAAMALQRVGVDAVVYEAYDRAADDVGMYLGIVPNGMDALHTLGLYETTRTAGFDMPTMAIFSSSGRKLVECPLQIPADGVVAQLVRRADLYVALRDEAVRRGARMEYGKRLIAAESTAAGVSARFTDGSTAQGDLLVGADGLHSRVREIINPGAPPAGDIDLLNIAGYARGVGVDAKPGVLNVVIGRCCRYGYIRIPDGDMWWFATPASPRDMSRAEFAAVTPQQWRARLIELFSADRGPAVELIRATNEIFVRWGTYNFHSAPIWHSGGMVVIGDAAHAGPDAHGASMALEDAVTLAKCLRDLPTVHEAFLGYDKLCRPRVERVLGVSKRNFRQQEVGPLRRLLRDHVIMPLIARKLGRSTYTVQTWLFNYHIDWDEPVQYNGNKVTA